MAKLNLDDLRAARAEVRHNEDIHELELGGQAFVLPAELPFDFGLISAEAQEQPSRLRDAFALLFGDQFDAFWSQRPTNEDMRELMEWLKAEYGTSVGEAPPSGPSSPNTGGPSRATSNGTTGSTFGSPAGGPTP